MKSKKQGSKGLPILFTRSKLENQPNNRIQLSVITQFFPPDFAATGQLIEELVKQLGISGVDIDVGASVGIRLDEGSILVREEVRGVCEILGLDPLYLANEGKLVVVVRRSDADTVLAAMRSHSAGANACAIGEVIDAPAGIVLMRTCFGSQRIVDMLVGDQLPRIC